MMNLQGLRVLLYKRVSTPQQKNRSVDPEKVEPSLGEQEEKMLELAKNRGWVVVGILEDVITGSIYMKDRKSGSIIYQMAISDEFDVLMVYDDSRIGRDEDALVAKIFRTDMRQYNKQIFSVFQPIEPVSPNEYEPYENDSPLFQEAFSDANSAIEIRKLRRRHTFGMEKRVKEKRLTAGTPGIGYKAERITLPNGKTFLGERIIDNEFSPLIQRIFNDYESGYSYLKIAGLLNKEGFRTPIGKLWSGTTIKGIITNPIYYGATVYYKSKTKRKKRIKQPMEDWLIVDGAVHPSIITKAQWERCQYLRKSKGSYGRTYGESTLLSGMQQCGKCGSSMSKNGGWGGGYFTCNKYLKTGKSECCPNSIRREYLEKFVVEYIAKLAKDPIILDKLRVKQNNNQLVELNRLNSSIDFQKRELRTKNVRIMEAYESGEYTLEMFSNRRAEIEKQQQALENNQSDLTNKIAVINRSNNLKKSLTELMSNFLVKFNSKPLRIQKMLIRELIDKIVVNSGKVKIIFKDDLFSSSDYERSIEIAAAGGHNLLFSGPPGSGKTLLARCMPSILPCMNRQEKIEVSEIYSAAGRLKGNVISERPFRSPHHTTSNIALIGGGSHAGPGEVTLAHGGVLFLDELPEFSKVALETLRQPLEDGKVTIARAQKTVEYPAKFILMAAQNPCPCGYETDPDHECSCTPSQVIKYQKKISGPLLDRMDLFVSLPAVKVSDLENEKVATSSQKIREKVTKARQHQSSRRGNTLNAYLTSKTINQHAKLKNEVKQTLIQAVNKMHLSARAYYKVIKVARTIADLENQEEISVSHIAEALQYRRQQVD